MVKSKTPGICPICSEPTKPGRTFCSRTCAGKYASARPASKIDTNFDWKKNGGGSYFCRYQENVECSDRNCAKCGWNPKVAAERSAAFARKRERESQKAKYLADRAKGMSYQEIAEKYGVSKWTVQNAIANQFPQNFRQFTEVNCVYPNLRNWLNENQVTLQEFTKRLVEIGHMGNSSAVGAWFRGVCYPTKVSIDRILKVTGLTYEQLFATEV